MQSALTSTTPASAVNALPPNNTLVAIPGHAASSPQTIAITLLPTPQTPQSVFENGTVFVALFALLGVLVTVYAAHRRMLRELAAVARNAAIDREQTREQARLEREHSAAEAHRERLTVTRRQVYLDTASAVGTAQKYLGGLAGGDFGKNTYEAGLIPLVTAVNQIAIVGEMPTVQVARELLTAVHELFFEAVIKVAPISGHQAEVALQNRVWQEAQEEIKRILAEMRAFNEDGRSDGRFELLSRNFELAQSRAQRASEAEQRAQKQVAKAQLEYADFVITRTNEMTVHINRLAESVRAELGIATDAEAFRLQTQQTQAAVHEAMAKFKAALSKVDAQ